MSKGFCFVIIYLFSFRLLSVLSKYFLISAFCLYFSSLSISSYLRAEELIPQITRPTPEIDLEIKPYLFDEAFSPKEKSIFDIIYDLSKKPGEMLEDSYRLQKEKVSKRGSERPLLEVYSGGDGRIGDYGFYAGGVTGPLENHINLKALRLRAGYGQGVSEYSSKYHLSDNLFFAPHIKSKSEFFEGLIGYEFKIQKSIFKVYGGVLHEKRKIDEGLLKTQIDKFISFNFGLSGTAEEREKAKNILLKKTITDHEDSETGAKFLLEVWHDFANSSWFSGYASYSFASDFYAAHSRLGIPLYYNIDIGGEFSVYGNRYSDLMRAGFFSRIKDGDGEWTVSFGLDGSASDLHDFSFRKENMYISLQYFQQFYLSEITNGLSFP